MHMKYKNLLSLAFAIILAQSLYGQSVVVSSTNADVEHWGDDNVRVTFTGNLVDGSSANSLTTIDANLRWHGDMAILDNAMHTKTGSYDVSIGVAFVVDISVPVGANVQFNLTLTNLRPGEALLEMHLSAAAGSALKLGGTYDKFVGYVYRDRPGKSFGEDDQADVPPK